MQTVDRVRDKNIFKRCERQLGEACARCSPIASHAGRGPGGYFFSTNFSAAELMQ
jgi:hypothetical protein